MYVQLAIIPLPDETTHRPTSNHHRRPRFLRPHLPCLPRPPPPPPAFPPRMLPSFLPSVAVPRSHRTSPKDSEAAAGVDDEILS